MVCERTAMQSKSTSVTRGAPTVVLFLDFDGVTHPDPCDRSNEFCRLPLIESVVRTFAAVEIVISSAWRDHYTLDKLRQHFAADMQERVVGVTPSLKHPSPVRRPASGLAAAQEWEVEACLLAHRPEVHEREWEIEAWLSANRPPDTPWLAIDDRPHLFLPNSQNVLLTNSANGFHPSQQQTLRLMLRLRDDEI